MTIPSFPDKFPGKIPFVKLQALAARGGTALSYLGLIDHPELPNQMFVKVVNEAKHRDLLEREAYILATFPNHHVPQIYPIPWANNNYIGHTIDNQNNPQWYILLDFIDGRNLREVLSSGRLPVQELLAQLRPLAEYLDTLHEHGMCHSDISSGNVVITDNAHSYLIDFGFAQNLGQGLVAGFGTPFFIAPERYWYHNGTNYFVTRSEDIYAFAVMTLSSILCLSPDAFIMPYNKLNPHTHLSSIQPDFLDRLTPQLKETFITLTSIKAYNRPRTTIEIINILDAQTDELLDLQQEHGEEKMSPPPWDTPFPRTEPLAKVPEMKYQTRFLLTQQSPTGGLTERLLNWDETQLDASTPPSSADESKQSPDEVTFSAYHASSVSPGERTNVFAYLYTEATQGWVERDVAILEEEQFGDQPSALAQANKNTQIQQSTPITATLECEGVTVEEPTQTEIWNGSFIRFDFILRLEPNIPRDTLSGRIAFSVHGIEINAIPLHFSVDDQTPDVDTNPLLAAKLTSTTASIYQKIFVSYSRKDTTIVENYRLAQLCLGNDIFLDRYNIKPGENWRAALARAIDEADIFQLFWSENSAASRNCRDEWEYALEVRCQGTDCSEFIRPVYWVSPMTDDMKPPAELKHLNFKYAPLDENEHQDENPTPPDSEALLLNINEKLEHLTDLLTPLVSFISEESRKKQ